MSCQKDLFVPRTLAQNPANERDPRHFAIFRRAKVSFISKFNNFATELQILFRIFHFFAFRFFGILIFAISIFLILRFSILISLDLRCNTHICQKNLAAHSDGATTNWANDTSADLSPSATQKTDHHQRQGLRVLPKTRSRTRLSRRKSIVSSFASRV
jgi:hypothetical protein